MICGYFSSQIAFSLKEHRGTQTNKIKKIFAIEFLQMFWFGCYFILFFFQFSGLGRLVLSHFNTGHR